MRGTNARGRRRGHTAILLAVAAGLAGCVDSGLPDRNLPKAEAEQRTYAYPVYQMTPEAQTWELAGRRWATYGAATAIDSTLLRQVASAAGTTVYALTWDEEPYDRLFTRGTTGGWQVLESID